MMIDDIYMAMKTGLQIIMQLIAEKFSQLKTFSRHRNSNNVGVQLHFDHFISFSL